MNANDAGILRHDQMDHILAEAVKVLNQGFACRPILFASVALEMVLGQAFDAHDIDLLVPNKVQKQTPELIRFFADAGFSFEKGIVPTFVKEGIAVELSNLEKWVRKCRWRLADLKTIDQAGCQYQVLGIEDLVRLYQVLSQDPTRSNSKKQSDQRKLMILQKLSK